MRTGEGPVRVGQGFCLWLLTLTLAGLLLVACGRSEEGGAEQPSDPAGGGAPAAGAPTEERGASEGQAAESGGTEGGGESEEAQQALYEAAREEGEVVFWTSWNRETTGPLIEMFEEKYPGLTVDYFEISPGDSIPRILAKSQAGRFSTDVAQGHLSDYYVLVEQDLVASHDYSGIFGIHPELVFDERLVVVYHQAYPIAVNTNLVSPDEMPKDWEDLLDPKWKGGKIMVPAGDSTYPPVALGFEWGEERMYEYVRALAEQDIRITRSASETSTLIKAGESPIAFGVNLFTVLRDKPRGAPIAIAPLSPLTAVNNGVFALANAEHPNAAQLWIAFLVSPEAQRSFDEVAKRSLIHPDFPSSSLTALNELGIELIRETPENLEKFVEMKQKAQEILGTE